MDNTNLQTIVCVDVVALNVDIRGTPEPTTECLEENTSQVLPFTPTEMPWNVDMEPVPISPMPPPHCHTAIGFVPFANFLSTHIYQLNLVCISCVAVKST